MLPNLSLQHNECPNEAVGPNSHFTLDFFSYFRNYKNSIEIEMGGSFNHT